MNLQFIFDGDLSLWFEFYSDRFVNLIGSYRGLINKVILLKVWLIDYGFPPLSFISQSSSYLLIFFVKLNFHIQLKIECELNEDW